MVFVRLAAPACRRDGTAAILGYLVYAWGRVGRDPRPGTVVPIFSPPDDLSPAAMRYIVEQKLEDRAFAASLVDAAVRAMSALVEDDRGFFQSTERRIERHDRTDTKPLDATEQRSLNALVGPSETFVMEQKNHAEFSAAKKALSEDFA